MLQVVTSELNPIAKMTVYVNILKIIWYNQARIKSITITKNMKTHKFLKQI